jgi:hypothetical protein
MGNRLIIHIGATDSAKFSSLTRLSIDGALPHADALRTLPSMCPKLENVEIKYPRDHPYNFSTLQVLADPLLEGFRDHCPMLTHSYTTAQRFVANWWPQIKLADQNQQDKEF